MLARPYANRRTIATSFVGSFATFCGLAHPGESFSKRRVFDRYRFLAQVLEKAGSQAEVGRVLNIPSSRLSELFNPDAVKPRRLKLEEAVTLSEAFRVPITGDSASAESLLTVLRVCLRHPPKEWTDSELRRLAEEIELGLQLRQALDTSSQSAGRPDQERPGEGPPQHDRRD